MSGEQGAPGALICLDGGIKEGFTEEVTFEMGFDEEVETHGEQGNNT